MIIEYVLTMWADLFMAGYRPLPKPQKPQKPESWTEYLERTRFVVEQYKKERKR